jgi:glycosyltransferase involved in cell wall biosynthesis
VKVLLELRPALDGHAGIPQETRLLFRALARMPGIEVEGLLQSSNKVVARGLPADESAAAVLSDDRRIYRLSRVVVSLQQAAKTTIVERLLAIMHLAIGTPLMLMRALLGVGETLGRFEAERFRDFVWRALFARTLPPGDFDSVTARRFRVARLPWSSMHAAALFTKRFGLAIYPRLDTRGFDLMIAETPYPGRVRRPTRMVVRYHDAIPVLMPHTISDRSYHQASHFNALRRNVRDGAWFACVSEASRRDLLAIFPDAEPRAVTIPNMVSHHYFAEASDPAQVPEIVRTRLSQSIKNNQPDLSRLRGDGRLRYLLMVSTIEPRKNHLTLLAAWEHLRAHVYPDLKLILVGMLGWEHKPIVRRFRPWLERGDLYILEDVPSPELRLLYRHAAAAVCPSFGEGFDFSGIEAMRCGTVVAASDIPVHREIFDAAAEYFNPYSAAEISAAVSRLIGEGAQARRAELLRQGEEVSGRYQPERIAPLWQGFLARLRNEPA